MEKLWSIFHVAPHFSKEIRCISSPMLLYTETTFRILHSAEADKRNLTVPNDEKSSWG